VSELSKLDSVGGVTIYSVSGEPKAILFMAGATICADGAANCYGPNNTGIDYTANGGTPGSNWWGGPTDEAGWPLEQQIYDPCPGMYVSATAHFNPAYTTDSQYRYIDSAAIPFIVLPGNHSNGAKLGDVALVLNTVSGDNCFGIYADVGPSGKIGEISMRMATALKLNHNPKSGGIVLHEIAYLVFPGSVASWKPPKIWFDTANTLTKAWGGLSRLVTLAKQL
jgi:Fungal chitosanase of glycosyl hydrolase group 75